jgi:hypothetical protein
MPAGPALLASLDEFTKRMYTSARTETVMNITHPILANIAPTGTEKLGGAGFYGNIRTRTHSGHAFIAENASLPTGGITKGRQWVAMPTTQVGVTEGSGLAMAMTSQDAASFVRAYDENVDFMMQEMWTYREGVALRDGSGLLATFVDDPAGSSTGPYILSDVGFLRPGMLVDIIDDAATGTTRHHLRMGIEAVDWILKKVTFTSAISVNVGVGDRVFLSYTQADSGTLVNMEPVGLDGSVAETGTYLGIDRSLEEGWRGSILQADKFFDEDIFMRARTRVQQRTGRGVGSMGGFAALMHAQQLDVLFRLAMPRIQYTAGGPFNLGHNGQISFGNMDSIWTSHDVPPATAWLGDFSKHKTVYAPGGELHIDSEYNGSAMKWVSGKDNWLVFAKSYFTFINTSPHSFVKVTNLSLPSR